MSKIINTRIPDEIYTKLQELEVVKNKVMSISVIVRLAIIDWLKVNKAE